VSDGSRSQRPVLITGEAEASSKPLACRDCTVLVGLLFFFVNKVVFTIDISYFPNLYTLAVSKPPPLSQVVEKVDMSTLSICMIMVIASALASSSKLTISYKYKTYQPILCHYYFTLYISLLPQRNALSYCMQTNMLI